MDPASQRALILVMVAGSIVVAIGTVTLVIIFRKFGEAKAGGRSHNTLIAALIAFILLCCAGLFALSYLG
jgi:hypothetical protein